MIYIAHNADIGRKIYVMGYRNDGLRPKADMESSCVPVEQNLGRLHVVQIFVESVHVQAGVQKRIGPLKYVVPKTIVDRYIHNRHFPNNLLVQLHKKRKIRFRGHQLPFKQQYSNRDAENIPVADVWVFSHLNHAVKFAFEDSFFERVKARAKQKHIAVINL